VRRIILYATGLVLWLPGIINAQRVIYSEALRFRSDVQVQVIGRSGDYYWIEKTRKQKSANHHVSADNTEIQSFGLLDSKLNLLKESPPIFFPGTLKQWLIAGEKGLDQILLTSAGGKTKIIGSRYLLQENSINPVRLIDSLPFTANPSSFLLIRSEDQSKILLVAYENTDSALTFVHALLFDSDWNPIYHRVISQELFSQPCIQDDEISFPAESFDNLPIKLANNGEWLMASPSRISHNFSLFHASSDGSKYYFREIPLSRYYKMEDIAMSIDNDRQEMSVAFLSAYSNTSLKNVQVYNYSMKLGRFDFDSSYHFNTQSHSVRDKNLSHESFISVPGTGYMLLKEYGVPFDFKKPAIPVMNNWESAYLLANYAEINTGKEQMKQGYTVNRGLSPIPAVRNKGDLNLFYFPARSGDSTWSGVLSMEQQSESNNPELSYLLLPVKNKLFIIYNSIDGYTDRMATTTTLNMNGQTADDALVFWKMNRMLNFQHAHRFSAGDVAVSYMRDQQAGFAIIRLD
jgi:hypothetical protein